jgi:hypothetical protein
MIIKITPENEFEAQRMQEVEHTGIKEFFIFGNKLDNEGSLIDFHDWKGSYRYLEGSLYHFLTTITEEKKKKANQLNQKNEISLKPQSQNKPPFIKRGQVGQVNENDLKIINVEDLSKQAPQPIQFPPVITNEETPSKDEKDEEIEAEDKTE